MLDYARVSRNLIVKDLEVHKKQIAQEVKSFYTMEAVIKDWTDAFTTAGFDISEPKLTEPLCEVAPSLRQFTVSNVFCSWLL